MLYALLVFLLLLVVLFSFPAGAEFICEEGKSRRALIVCGLRFRLRKKKIVERKARKSVKPTVKREASEAEIIPSVLQELDGEDVQAAWISLRRLTKCVRLRVHKLDVHIATPDPATTGMLYGLACAGTGFLNLPGKITLNADFTRTTPVFDYRIEVSVIPGRVMFEGAGALWRLILRKPKRRRLLFSIIGRKKRHV